MDVGNTVFVARGRGRGLRKDKGKRMKDEIGKDVFVVRGS